MMEIVLALFVLLHFVFLLSMSCNNRNDGTRSNRSDQPFTMSVDGVIAASRAARDTLDDGIEFN